MDDRIKGVSDEDIVDALVDADETDEVKTFDPDSYGDRTGADHHGHDHHDHDEHGHHDHDHGCCGCCCHDDDDDDEDPEEAKKERTILIGRLIASVLLAVLAAVIPFPGKLGIIKVLMFAAAYLISAYDMIFEMGRDLIKGRVFNEVFLMTVAAIGAICIGEYPEAVAVTVLYRIGELLEEYAEGRSRRSISELTAIRPDHANLLLEDGDTQKVDPQSVKVDDVIVIKTGERVPLDGVVVEGSASMDMSALTGESAPADVEVGGEVFSGSVDRNGTLYVRVTKVFGESTVSRVLSLIEDCTERKSKSERFITKFARWYTPAVVGAAVLIALIGSLVTHEWRDWIGRALNFLVVSCPCALVISVPLSFFGGMGRASKNGILIKGSSYIESLADCSTVVFDKTGTLTRGSFKVSRVVAVKVDRSDLLRLAATAEAFSDHPIAASLKEAWGGPIDLSQVSDTREAAGYGVVANINTVNVFVGNAKLMEKLGLGQDNEDETGTVVHVAAQPGDGSSEPVYLGRIIIEDEIKDRSRDAVSDLAAMGITDTVLLSGDSEQTVKKVAASLGISGYSAHLMPDEKVAAVEELLARERKGTLVFTGDGINDAPALARADVGVAMGALGTDAAIESADVVIMDDDPASIPKAIRIARFTRSIVRQNIVLSIGVKLLVLLLSVLGVANMYLAVFADVGVLLLAILNSSRALLSNKS